MEMRIERHIGPINNYKLLKSNQIHEFVNSSSMKLFERFNISTVFLNGMAQKCRLSECSTFA